MLQTIILLLALICALLTFNTLISLWVQLKTKEILKITPYNINWYSFYIWGILSIIFFCIFYYLTH